MNQQEKARIRAREWYKNNKEKALASAKLRASNPVQKLKKREYDRNYRILYSAKINGRVSEWYLNHLQLMKNRSKIWKQKNPEKTQFNHYLENAKKRKCVFGLNFEEFKEAINMPCVYCGFAGGFLGIDRIDSAKGYERDNIVPCCKVCNFMKLDNSVEEWFSAMRDIFNNQGYEITPSTKTGSRE